jgi:hypothetical protein
LFANDDACGRALLCQPLRKRQNQKLLYSHSTLKNLNRALREGCAVRSASRHKVWNFTKSADVTLILQDASQVESL